MCGYVYVTTMAPTKFDEVSWKPEDDKAGSQCTINRKRKTQNSSTQRNTVPRLPLKAAF